MTDRICVHCPRPAMENSSYCQFHTNEKIQQATKTFSVIGLLGTVGTIIVGGIITLVNSKKNK